MRRWRPRRGGRPCCSGGLGAFSTVLSCYQSISEALGEDGNRSICSPQSVQKTVLSSLHHILLSLPLNILDPDGTPFEMARLFTHHRLEETPPAPFAMLFRLSRVESLVIVARVSAALYMQCLYNEEDAQMNELGRRKSRDVNRVEQRMWRQDYMMGSSLGASSSKKTFRVICSGLV